MRDTRRRSLLDYLEYAPWLPQLGLSEDDLRRVPAHDVPDTEGVSLGLGYINPGAPPSVEGELNVVGTRQLWVYESDTPPSLWGPLRSAVRTRKPSGYPKEDILSGPPDVGIRDEDKRDL